MFVWTFSKNLAGPRDRGWSQLMTLPTSHTPPKISRLVDREVAGSHAERARHGARHDVMLSDHRLRRALVHPPGEKGGRRERKGEEGRRRRRETEERGGTGGRSEGGGGREGRREVGGGAERVGGGRRDRARRGGGREEAAQKSGGRPREVWERGRGREGVHVRARCQREGAGVRGRECGQSAIIPPLRSVSAREVQ